MTKLSIFTPTHSSRYLLDTFESILRQDYRDFEWVIVPNTEDGKELPELPPQIVEHEKVKIAPFYWKDRPKIGELKRYACDNADGDVFVELDHDDALVPGVLAKIAKTFEQTGAGFIYSDGASFSEAREEILPQTYHGDYGWESYDFEVYGKTFIATRNFPISPRSLCEIYFAPDHVRCWSKEAYYKIGGHNVELAVCDDHDLMVRTYLAGFQFAHIGGVGYLYRFHSSNSVKSFQDEIQVETTKIRNASTRKLIAEWCRREKLHVGRFNELEDWEAARDGGLTYGWIELGHEFLPKLTPHWPSTLALFREFYARLVPGGYLSATYPSATGAAAFAPHYKSYWSAHTFEYFTHKGLAAKSRDNLPAADRGLEFPRFQFVRYDEYCKGMGSAQLGKITAEVDLLALKDQRVPGRVYI